MSGKSGRNRVKGSQVVSFTIPPSDIKKIDDQAAAAGKSRSHFLGNLLDNILILCRLKDAGHRVIIMPGEQDPNTPVQDHHPMMPIKRKN